MGGDFNSRHVQWGSRLSNTKGQNLFKAIRETGCEFISTGKPTYWPTDRTKIPDLIDFFITRKVSKNFMTIEDGFDLCSDHSPIYLTLYDSVLKMEEKPYLYNKYTDWNYFRLLLQQDINLNLSIQTESQLDELVLKFTKQIQQAAWKSTPKIKPSVEQHRYSPEIKEMVIKKRNLRKRWQQTRDPLVKRVLNKLGKKLSKLINTNKNTQTNMLLGSLTSEKNSNYSLWKYTKNHHQKISQNPPIKLPNGEWALSNEDKANLFSNHLVNIFQPNSGDGFVPQENITYNSLEIAPTDPTEIRDIIKTLKSKKAPGFELITTEILNELPHTAINMLSILFNTSLRLQYFPIYWKFAEVKMIQKPGKPPSEVTSYRPISLLPAIAKLFERIIIRRIQPIVTEKQIIPNHQFGFRNEHSTIEQVHRICDTIEKALEGNQICTAIFLDVSQAFDKVWHQGLLFKIREYLPVQLSNLIESYLSSRYFRIKYEEAYSEIRLIQAGVPQGSILGPILYLLYTSDIPSPSDTQIATFADDTAILATAKTINESIEKAQNAINIVTSWTSKWRIKLNNNKSIHVDFTNKNIKHKDLTIFNLKVPYANTAKYLGMNLDAKLRWKEHIKKKKEELEIRYRELKWLLSYKSKLSLHNKLIIYKQVLAPIWQYGIQLWGCAKISNTNIIQRFQNKILRKMVNAPWYIRNADLHRDLKIDTVQEIIKKYAVNHHNKLQQHSNEEASRLFYEPITERRLRRIKPRDLLAGDT